MFSYLTSNHWYLRGEAQKLEGSFFWISRSKSLLISDRSSRESWTVYILLNQICQSSVLFYVWWIRTLFEGNEVIDIFVSNIMYYYFLIVPVSPENVGKNGSSFNFTCFEDKFIFQNYIETHTIILNLQSFRRYEFWQLWCQLSSFPSTNIGKQFPLKGCEK